MLVLGPLLACVPQLASALSPLPLAADGDAPGACAGALASAGALAPLLEGAGTLAPLPLPAGGEAPGAGAGALAPLPLPAHFQ